MSARGVLQVPVAKLTPDPNQPRKTFSEESLLGLAKTMATGQLQPILAFERGGQIFILDGERRYRAAKLAGMTSVDVLIVDAAAGGEILEKSLVANMQREDFPALEKSRAIARLMESTGLPASQIAIRLGISSATISRLLSLLSLPEPIQDQVNRGEISPSTAAEIARSESDAEKALLASEVVKGGLSRDSVAGKRRSSSKRTTASQRKTSRLSATLGGGRAITLAGPGLSSLDVMIEWLEELLGRARKARPKGMEPSTFLALLRDEARAKKQTKEPASGGAK